MVLPCRTDDLSDDPAYRDRAHTITARHARAISDTVQELTEMGLIENAAVQIRAHPACPGQGVVARLGANRSMR
jgi:hypothetical protein